MWDHGTVARFNWLWQDATTFSPYQVETSFENNLLVRANSVSVHGAQVVLKSLTRNGRKSFWILLRAQRAHQGEAGWRGLRFAEYLAACQRDFAAHDGARLRSYMTEYHDHKLLEATKHGGVEHLRIPVEDGMLAAIEDMMTENFVDDRP
eukprot:UC1_evm1s1239